MESDYEPTMSNTSSIMEKRYGEFGCSHYRRRCKIRAPCCDEIFDCRHCHNESKNSIEVDPFDRHDVPRHDIRRVIFSLCGKEQDGQQHCNNCGVCMGNYFCSKCNFFDDEVSKNQYHCNECGICRIGGEENFFHCNRCGCCYSKTMKNSHNCVKKALHHNCAVCFERHNGLTMRPHYTFGMRKRGGAAFPVASTTMPQTYQNKMVWILCNDCGENSEVNFHILARKCLKCSSYNARRTRGVVASCLSDIAKIVR